MQVRRGAPNWRAVRERSAGRSVERSVGGNQRRAGSPIYLTTLHAPVKHSFTMGEDLSAMAVFAAVAEARGFRAAGERLGVSYLYYPHRRHASPALRALIEHVRRARRQPARGSKSTARTRGDAAAPPRAPRPAKRR
jgi:hypothetical protein